jgi:site-specific recombinase XerD
MKPTGGPTPATPLIRSFAYAKRLGWAAANVRNAVAVLNRTEAWLVANGSSLKAATREELDGYLGHRLDTVSPNTVIIDQRQLRAFYKWACAGDDPYLERNPAKGTGTIKGDEPDPGHCPVVAEWMYRALLATCRRAAKPTGKGTKSCNDRRDAAMIAVLWDTGCRRDELAHIEYRHVDWDQGTIHLARTKGRTKTRSRDIPVGDEALDLLTRYVERDRGDHDGPLFESTHRIPGSDRRQPIKAQAVYLMLRRRADQANAAGNLPGVVHAPTHAFRRASAINDIDLDISARAIQTAKGWKHDGRMLSRYTKEAETRQTIEEYRTKRAGRHLRAVGD